MKMKLEELKVGDVLIADGSSNCLPKDTQVLVQNSYFFHVEGQPWHFRPPVKAVFCLAGHHELVKYDSELIGFRKGFKQ